MVTESEKNIVAFSDYLPKDYPQLYGELEKILKDNNIEYKVIKGTADYWCRDYMPVQVASNRCIRFKYTPDYLIKMQGYQTLVTDEMVRSIAPGMEIIDCPLVVDGGNIVCNSNCVVMTEKVFCENPHYSREQVIELLNDAFQTDNIVFVPWEGKRYDKFGHTDGMLRFVPNVSTNQLTILVNLDVYGKAYSKKTRDVLEQHFNVVELKLSTYDNMNWAYINSIQTKDVLIVPGIHSPNDQEALRQLEQLYSTYQGKIYQVQMRDFIHRGGGALNCCSWTINVYHPHLH